MAAPNPKRQKVARAQIKDCVENPQNWSVVHYSCESFNDRPNGQSPRITSIAALDMATGQVSSFSIHLNIELAAIDPDDVRDEYDTLELQMLEQYFSHLNRYQDRRYLHWNMRDVGYGFKAIEHRFRVLGGPQDALYVIDDSRKLDLANVLRDIYGDEYIGHPRMGKLLELNGKTPRYFLAGVDEAVAFEEGRYFNLHQSALGKVQAFADVARLVYDGKLKTKSSWWDLHGGGVREFANWLSENPKWGFIGSLVGVIGIIVGIVGWLQ